MKIIYLSFIFLLSSCATKPVQTENKTVKKKPKKIKVIEEVLNVGTLTGKVSFVEFPVNLPDSNIDIICTDDKNKSMTYKFIVQESIARGYIGENYFSPKGVRNCYVGKDKALVIETNYFNYKKEKLNVAKGKVDLSQANLARVIRERKITKEVYSNSSKNFLFSEPFMRPLNSFITSHYGNQRLFNNKKRSQHLGNDFRAAVGVKIPVANRGRVVFVGDLFYSGNVVIVDHGMEIFSFYGHLSKILVSKGDIVNKGDIVGLAGMTGRVTGPHLHWGVKINGFNVDGFSLVEESKKQFREQ
jgi:murein DD-endopeptidase MepM/ murein hydrolase activator NlpD